MKFILTSLIILTIPLAVHCQFYISSGTTVTVLNGGDITFEDIGLNNGGVLSQGNSTLIFQENNSNTNTGIEGNGTMTFGNITVNMGNHNLILADDIEVNGTISMVSGAFDLGSQTLILGPNGTLAGENETSCLIGTGGGQIQKEVELNAPFEENPGNLGAVITSGVNLGTTIISRSHLPATNGSNAGIERIYHISPTNNSALDATLRFHYLDNELNGNTESDLDLWRNDGSGWTNEGFTSRNTTEDWIELTGIDAFSDWTATSPANALPVELLFFSAKKLNKSSSLLEWVTSNEINNKGFEIQRSTFEMPSRWETLEFIEGKGNSSDENYYSFIDQAPAIGANYYRLRQLDFNGQEQLSKVEVVQFAIHEEVMLGEIFPNPAPIGKTSVFLPVFSNEFSYVAIEILNAQGQQVGQLAEQISNGENLLNLNFDHLPPGTYTVQIQIGQNRFSKKLIVQ